MRRMLCGGTAMLNTLSWAVNTSPLTLSRHVSGVFENAIRWAMSATFTAELLTFLIPPTNNYAQE